MVEYFICQEMQDTAVNESNYLLRNLVTIIPSKSHPTLSTLNQIVLIYEHSYIDDKLDEYNMCKNINDHNNTRRVSPPIGLCNLASPA